MGGALQADRLSQVGQVVEVSDDAAVVGVEEGLQHEAGEELGLSKGSWRAAVAIRRKGPFSDMKGHRRHLPW